MLREDEAPLWGPTVKPKQSLHSLVFLAADQVLTLKPDLSPKLRPDPGHTPNSEP